MNEAPIVRQTNWLSAIPQILVLGSIVIGLLSVTNLTTKGAAGVGALIYLAYSRLSRFTFACAHSTGMQYLRAGNYLDAIPCFEESYQFFSRRTWLDRYRSLLLLSSSKASYREMALVNIAFCHGQIGEGERCREYYERAAIEFPSSMLAKAGLNMIRSQKEPEA